MQSTLKALKINKEHTALLFILPDVGESSFVTEMRKSSEGARTANSLVVYFLDLLYQLDGEMRSFKIVLQLFMVQLPVMGNHL